MAQKMCLIDKVLDLDQIELIDQVDGNGVQCLQQNKLSYVIWKDAKCPCLGSQKKVWMFGFIPTGFSKFSCFFFQPF